MVTLADGPEVTGKLTLNPTAVHVEGGSASDINLPDILEASFSDLPFHLDYFSSTLYPAKLPLGWRAQDIGNVQVNGSMSYANGTFTLSGDGIDLHDGEREFYAGQPWSGDGQWTVRVKECDGEGGLMIRDNFDGTSLMFGLGVFGGDQGKGLFHYRDEVGFGWGWGGDFPADLPTWLRLIRNGQSISGAISTDGKTWDTIGQYNTKTGSNIWVGLFGSSRNQKVLGKAVLDQVTFLPNPAQPETLPSGALLRSGSLLAGVFDYLNPKEGSFNRNGKHVSLTADQVAACVFNPVTMPQLADVSAQVGIIMKNGDFLTSDLQSIQGGMVQMNSLLLGPVTYYGDSVRATILHPVQAQPSDYEIRLKDGTILNAKSMSFDNGQFTITDVSGVNVPVGPEEIAQVRAGLSHVQPLISVAWKAIPPPDIAPSTNASTNAASAVKPADLAPAPATPPTASVPSSPTSVVQCWEGNNREQIMVVPAQATVNFPLTGKFRAVALRIALSPDSPPDAQAMVRFLADGQEVGRTPPFKAGDLPRFVEITLQNPKTVTLEADSISAGTRVLYLDPVAIRDIDPSGR